MLSFLVVVGALAACARAASIAGLDPVAFADGDATFEVATLDCTGLNFTEAAAGDCLGEFHTDCGDAFTSGSTCEIDLSATQIGGWQSTGTDGAAGFSALGALVFNDTTDFSSLGVDPEDIVGRLASGGELTYELINPIDSRINYEFQVNVCPLNASAGGDITLTVCVGDSAACATPMVEITDVDVTAAFVEGAFRQATITIDETALECDTLSVKIRHYELFDHVNDKGFTIAISSDDPDVAIEAAVLTPTVFEDVESGNGNTECLQTFINEIDFNVTTPFEEGILADPLLDINAFEIAARIGTNINGFTFFIVDGINARVVNTGGSRVTVDTFIDDDDNDSDDGFGHLTITLPASVQGGLGNGEISADGIAMFDGDDNLIQYLCYGPNLDTGAAVEMLGAVRTCTHIVDIDGNALNDAGDGGESLSLEGCGECFQDFDFAVNARSHNADQMPFDEMIDMGMTGGDVNERQSFCVDRDQDGHWADDTLFAHDAAGLETPGPATRCTCGGNDCQPRYSHIFFGAPEVCDGFVSNCNATSLADTGLDELDEDGDGRIQCDGDCNDDPATNGTIAFGLAANVVDNVFYPNLPAEPSVQPNITVSAQCPDETLLDSNIVGITDDLCNVEPTVDVDPSAHEEECDGFDNNCDEFGEIDDGLGPSVMHFADQDFDGHGTIDFQQSDTKLLVACRNEETGYPIGWSQTHDDCNDTDATINPSEIDDTCNGVDNDCNLLIDDLAFFDEDLDTFPNETCVGADGIAGKEADCDDSNPHVFPDAPDRCDGLKNNCTADDIEESDFDSDGDFFVPCFPFELTFSNLTFDGGDCNDSNIDIHPGALDSAQECDGLDNNCNLDIDEEEAVDADGDLFPNVTCSFSTIELITRELDCNDDDNQINPDATERCNGIDDNCDLVLADFEIDADNDTFVACTAAEFASDATEPFFNAQGVQIVGGGDCVDTDSNINPGVRDRCEFPCGKRDGRGPDDGAFNINNLSFTDCNQDLNDFAPSFVHPDDVGVDNNCDGLIDNDPDFNGDGDNDGAPTFLCLSSDVPLLRGVNSNGQQDCNDVNDEVNPLAEEICHLEIDDNCDGKLFPGEEDKDNDGVLACQDGNIQADCDDLDDEVNPLMPERCVAGEVKDRDCDGFTNNPFDNEDADGDGFPRTICPNSNSTISGKDEPDCNDDNALIYPGAEELCDGLDNDCDGTVPANEADGDGDGFRVCEDDCQDDNFNVNPGVEIDDCDTVDSDCDGSVDEDLFDGDGDGVPGATAFTSEGASCPGSAHPHANIVDCDDNDPNNSPLKFEIDFPGDDGYGDFRDNDCDLVADNGLPRLVGKADVSVTVARKRSHHYSSDDDDSSSSSSSSSSDSSSSTSSSSSDSQPQRVTITLTVENIGDGAANNVVIEGEISLPKGGQFLTTQLSDGGNFSLVMNADGEFLLQYNSINVGDEESVEIDVLLADEGDVDQVRVVAAITGTTGFTPNVVFTTI